MQQISPDLACYDNDATAYRNRKPCARTANREPHLRRGWIWLPRRDFECLGRRNETFAPSFSQDRPRGQNRIVAGIYRNRQCPLLPVCPQGLCSWNFVWVDALCPQRVACVHVSLGYSHAIEFLKRARAIDPNHYRLHSTLAEIARTEGRSADAISEYRLALRAVPESPAEGPLFIPRCNGASKVFR